MASTAAIVFLWRLGRTSRSAVLTGFLICAAVAGVVVAGVAAGALVCAIVDAATNSSAEIIRAFFIVVLQGE
jgi:hypothetical protein